MTFDIDRITSVNDTPFPLEVGRRDDGSPVGFTVLGSASEAYMRADREAQVQGVKDAAHRGGFTIDGRTDEGAQKIVEGMDRRADILIRHCVIGWFGFTKGETEPAEFTAEVLQLVLRAKPAWKRALLDAIESERNFTKG